MKKLTFSLVITFSVILLSTNIFAQDATVVDPEHYKVEFENDKVRVLRIAYAPGDKSVMHSHPEGVAVFLTDGTIRFTLPDETTQDIKVEAGQVIWSPESTHQPENTGKELFEVIQIEMKNNDE
ncbi:MAG: cupin domain-containing protein [Ignavibacteria bacterium]|nr:cupin domain-containing protein [Ignavibacteria bacterium]MBT8381111.1 cupin domain-containing protein [Ignavibacteria bacterium]MBT8392147.1 cupin domain-containing protein [Ignavibacteria bacterium]NNJ53547.1 cupin domain-containing protein [Ignavibacteriaceae bacterium]NNL21419.1 cupin domain-containing protein [Ignavibacteriaceae bacterium]